VRESGVCGRPAGWGMRRRVGRGTGRRVEKFLVLAVLLPVALAVPLLPAPARAVDVESNTVPSLVARDLAGRRFDLAASLQDGPALVTFWTTWCKPCRKELPELQKLAAAYGERGFHVVGVNGDGPVDRAKVRPYVNALGFTFTVIPDPDGEIRRRFQVEVFPTSFLVDGEGRVVYRQVGYRRGDEKILAERVRALLGEEPGAEPAAEPGEAPGDPPRDGPGSGAGDPGGR